MKTAHILLIVAVIALVIFVATHIMKKTEKKEKFTMKLYRPIPVLSVPHNTWDPADILTAELPSKDGPKLVIEKGNYRRFNRFR